MKLGNQPNGKHVMSLDFDLWDKEAKQTDKATEVRLQEYYKLNTNHAGMYESSTEGNINVLVDYSSSQQIRIR